MLSNEVSMQYCLTLGYSFNPRKHKIFSLTQAFFFKLIRITMFVIRLNLSLFILNLFELYGFS